MFIVAPPTCFDVDNRIRAVYVIMPDQLNREASNNPFWRFLVLHSEPNAESDQDNGWCVNAQLGKVECP